jgi:hypothetical protein
VNSVGKRHAGAILVPTARRPYSRIHEASAAGISLAVQGCCIAQSLRVRLDYRDSASHGAVCDDFSPIDECVKREETLPEANPCTLTMVALTVGTERPFETAI